MADSLIANSLDSSDGMDDWRQQVFVDTDTVYFFYVNDSKEPAYKKSVDGGATWASEVVIGTAGSTALLTITVWYDKWTPGDTGDLIHIAYMRNDTDGNYHKSLDTTSDTLSSEHTIKSGVNSSSSRGLLSMAKSRGGNLYCASSDRTASGATNVFARSVDEGVTWTDRADVWSGEQENVDRLAVFPGNEADADDMWVVFWDISATEVSLKTYDDSGDSFAETSIATSMTADAFFGVNSFFGSIRHSDNHLILAAHDESSNVSHALKVWDINGSGSITAKTSIFTATVDRFSVGLAIDNSNDDIYVAYFKNVTPSTLHELVYVVSTDGGTSWGSEVTVNSTDDKYRAIYVDLGNSGGSKTKFQPAYWERDATDVFNNVSTAVTIGNADILIDGSTQGIFSSTSRALVWTSHLIGYAIFRDSTSNVAYRKTTDGGLTWASAVEISAKNSIFSIWYDKWTQNDTGTKIHIVIAYVSSMDYYSLDTSSDTLSSKVTIRSAAAHSSGNVSIIKAKGGNLYVSDVGSNSATWTQSFMRSTDAGANWTSRASGVNISSTSGNRVKLVPGNVADDNDIIAVSIRSSNTILKVDEYDDDDGASGSWSTPVNLFTNNTSAETFFNVSSRGSNGVSIVVAIDNTSGREIRAWEVVDISNITELTRPQSSALTNLVSVSMCIDDTTSDLYCFYSYGTLITELTMFYKKSTDDGATWGSEVTYSDKPRKNSNPSPPVNVGSNGGWISAVWWELDDDELYINIENAIEILPAGLFGILHYLVLVPGP